MEFTWVSPLHLISDQKSRFVTDNLRKFRGFLENLSTGKEDDNIALLYIVKY